MFQYLQESSHSTFTMAHQRYQSWLWDSFKLYNNLYSFTTPYIFVIDLESHKLCAEKSPVKLLFWCLSIIINIILVTFCACIYNITKWCINPHYISINQIIGSIGTFTLCLLVLYSCHVHYKHRHEHVLGVNTLWNLHLSETRRQIKCFGRSKEQVLYHKILGLLLKGIVWSCWLVPGLFPFTMLEGSVNPWQEILDDITPAKWLENYPVHTFLLFHFPVKLFIGV